MAEAQQELITLIGKLKMATTLKVSKNDDEYYTVPLEVVETAKNGQRVSNDVDSIILIFWCKNFDEKNKGIISELKEGQNITVHGYYAGNDNGLLRVTELETEDDVFV